MKQSFSKIAGGLFPGSEITRKFTFKAIGTRDNSALLARQNRHLSQVFAVSGDRSTLFKENDCFERLSPHIKAA